MLTRTLTTLTTLIAAAAVAAVLVHPAPAVAATMASSDLLLPYFEVDLQSGRTTIFTVVNTAPERVWIEVDVFSNWGIEILSSTFPIAAAASATVDLGDWLRLGDLPERDLGEPELDHVRDALTGRPSAKTGLFYGNETQVELAVGYVKIRTVGDGRPDVLFGEYFLLDPLADLSQGDLLVDIDRAAESSPLCYRHGLRFLAAGGIDPNTEVVIWSRGFHQPESTPWVAERSRLSAHLVAHDRHGRKIDERPLELLPLHVMTVAELGLSATAGWLDLVSERETFLFVRHSAAGRFSAGFQSFCLPMPAAPDEPAPALGVEAPPSPAALVLETRLDGDVHDTPNGPLVVIGTTLGIEYRVANTGGVALRGVAVSDDRGVQVECPSTPLAPGRAMVCRGEKPILEEGHYLHVATVEATGPRGEIARDSETFHYLTAFSFGDDTDGPNGPSH